MLKKFLSVQGKKLLALQRDNSTQNYPTEMRQMIFKKSKKFTRIVYTTAFQILGVQHLSHDKSFFQFQIFDFLTLTTS